MAATYNEAGYAYNEPITYEGGTGTPPEPPAEPSGGGRPKRRPLFDIDYELAVLDDDLLLMTGA